MTTMSVRPLDSSRALLAALVLALTLLSGLAPAPAGAQESGDATAEAEVGVLATPAAELDCETLVAANPPSAVFAIDDAGSEARYRVEEELASVGATEAVGRTNALIGQILLDSAGLPQLCSCFDVDLRTLQSDEPRRDNYLYNNTLETERYPLATFVLSSVEGTDGTLVEGEETTVRLIGALTLHGVTKQVAWEATVTLEEDTITGQATTEFMMPDFNITPPKVGPVLSLEERVRLEIDLTLTRA
jgi:polyisoprenoid-binding protein YceI